MGNLATSGTFLCIKRQTRVWKTSTSLTEHILHSTVRPSAVDTSLDSASAAVNSDCVKSEDVL